MSDATPTPDPDAVAPDDSRLLDEPPQPPVNGESGTPLVNEKPDPTPDPGQVTSQVDGEMLIANLLVEIANLTRRALAAETMVQMYQRAAQTKSGQ